MMLTHTTRWSHPPGNAVVPSGWQATGAVCMEPGEVTRSAEAVAAAMEREMTDDERLAMVISVMAPNSLAPVRDSRSPDHERAEPAVELHP